MNPNGLRGSGGDHGCGCLSALSSQSHRYVSKSWVPVLAASLVQGGLVNLFLAGCLSAASCQGQAVGPSSVPSGTKVVPWPHSSRGHYILLAKTSSAVCSHFSSLCA